MTTRVFHSVLARREDLKFDDEVLEHLWNKYDANKDEDLDVSECQALMQGLVQNMKEEAEFLNALLDSQVRWLGEPGNVEMLREKFDTNHDGKVSKDEFKSQANTLLFADLLRKYEKWEGKKGEFAEKEALRVSQSGKNDVLSSFLHWPGITSEDHSVDSPYLVSPLLYVDYHLWYAFLPCTLTFRGGVCWVGSCLIGPLASHLLFGFGLFFWVLVIMMLCSPLCVAPEPELEAMRVHDQETYNAMRFPVAPPVTTP